MIGLLNRRSGEGPTDEQRADAAADRTRRRFARRQWARRWRAWRYLAASALLVVLVVTTVWLVWFSQAFTVTGVDVRGEQQLTERQVLAAARVPDG
jgi:cell division protein FtsQ